MRMMTIAAALLLAGCSGDDKGPGVDDTDTGTLDTGEPDTIVDDGLERETDCSGMDPSDAAPLGGWAALTFDDGPDPVVTPQILATLRKHQVPATFFMLGVIADDPGNADLIAEIIADPLFEVADHSWDHSNLQNLSLADARDQIGWTVDVLESHGADVEFFRFPYGAADCELVDIVRDEYGLDVAGWHIDTADWCYAVTDGTCSPDDYWRVPSEYQSDMYSWTLDQLATFDGGVFLYHDVHQYTADEVEDIIITAQAAGYTFTHLGDEEAFPRLNSGDPVDLPWVGEACSVSDDTCWQVEYLSYCAPTGDPDQPADAGVCVLDCAETRCIDRPGTAPLFCAQTAPGEGTCLGLESGYNEYCDAVPGTVASRLPGYTGGNGRVCVPAGWL
ncbi:MAG: peptidoglycan/xylan/chitin deacetylase (PgdA/CDA1 family) [Myxococcota bacterium]|jgi:peptidoglycan/xylan/chitin deacetylase (PgdA/CDA1 family)